MSIILIKPINFYRLIDFFCPSLLNLNISIILKFLKSGADHLLEYTIRFIVFVVKLFGKLFAKVGALIDFILRCLNVVIEPLFESVVHYFDYTIKYFGKILTKLVDFIYKYLVEITDYVFELVIFIVKAILKFFFKLFTGFNWSAVSHLTFDYVKDYIINWIVNITISDIIAVIKFIIKGICQIIYDWFFDWTYCDWFDIFFKMLTLFLLTINIILHLGKEYIVLWDPLPARRLNARYTFLMKVSGATLNSMFVCVTQIKDHITSTNFDWGPLFDWSIFWQVYDYSEFSWFGFANLPLDLDFLLSSFVESFFDFSGMFWDMFSFWDDEATMVGWSTLIDDGFEEGRKEHKVKKSRRDRLWDFFKKLRNKTK